MPTINKQHKRPVWAGKRVAFESGRVTKRWDGYGKQDWINFRVWFRVKYPLCSVEGCNQPTYYADHIVPVLQWIAQGGNPLDPDNIQPLCYKHGNKKTGHEGKAKQINRGGGGSSTPPGGGK